MNKNILIFMNKSLKNFFVIYDYISQSLKIFKFKIDCFY